jgi:hypothetical protein
MSNTKIETLDVFKTVETVSVSLDCVLALGKNPEQEE